MGNVQAVKREIEWTNEVPDPDGDFVEAIGRQHSAEKAAKIIVDHMSDWKGGKEGATR